MMKKMMQVIAVLLSAALTLPLSPLTFATSTGKALFAVLYG